MLSMARDPRRERAGVKTGAEGVSSDAPFGFILSVSTRRASFDGKSRIFPSNLTIRVV